MTGPKQKRKHHHGRLKEALVDYAITAAAEGAVESLSLRKASRDLGVSPGAAYRHFDTKDVLMRAVAMKGFDQLAEAFETAVPFDSDAVDAADAQARFVRLGTAYVTFAAANHGLWRLMFGPHGMRPENAEQDRATTYDWLGKVLSELAQFGVISPPTAPSQFFVWTAIHGLADLRGSPAAARIAEGDLINGQCRLVLAALGAGSL